MDKMNVSGSICIALLAAAPAFGQAAEAIVTLAQGNYEVVAQTVLPNLEENLRYATTRSLRCLGSETPASLFPILLHPAFSGCTLVRQEGAGDGLAFNLQCSNPEAATGTASLLLDDQHFAGTLDLKMGGKNMTLSQRISGSRRGGCAKAP